MKLKPSTEPKILLKPSTEPKIDSTMIAKVLGAEPMQRPPFVFANYPESQKLRQESEEHSVTINKEEWEQLVALAQELASEGQTPTPQQVGRALLRKALVDLLKGKQQLKESLQEQPSQVAE